MSDIPPVGPSPSPPPQGPVNNEPSAVFSPDSFRTLGELKEKLGPRYYRMFIESLEHAIASQIQAQMRREKEVADRLGRALRGEDSNG